MTLNEIFLSALELMGYSYSENIAAEYPFLANPLTLCNRVLLDLGIKSADSLSERLELKESVYEAACYGTAMFIAIYMGDSVKHSFFTEIYNAKRKGVLSKTEKIKDVIPFSEV